MLRALRFLAESGDTMAQLDATSAMERVPRPGEGECATLRDQHPLPFDHIVAFREHDHVYFVGGLRTSGSMTAFVKSPFEEFDEERTITRILACRRWACDEEYPYYQWPREEIAEYWEWNRDTAALAGTLLHETIEYWYNGAREPQDFPHPEVITEDAVAWGYFLDYQREVVEARGWTPLRTEPRVYCPRADLCGSVDMLYLRNAPGDGPNDVILVDWKRSKNLFGEPYRNAGWGMPPCTDLPNCSLSVYRNQLNGYRWVIERYTDLVIHEMHIVVFHPNEETYRMYAVDDRQACIATMIETRRAALVYDALTLLAAYAHELGAPDAGALDLLVTDDNAVFVAVRDTLFECSGGAMRALDALHAFIARLERERRADVRITFGMLHRMAQEQDAPGALFTDPAARLMFDGAKRQCV